MNLKIGDVLYENYSPSKLIVIKAISEWKRHKRTDIKLDYRTITCIDKKGKTLQVINSKTYGYNQIEGYKLLDELIKDHEKKLNTHKRNLEEIKKLLGV